MKFLMDKVNTTLNPKGRCVSRDMSIAYELSDVFKQAKDIVPMAFGQLKPKENEHTFVQENTRLAASPVFEDLRNGHVGRYKLISAQDVLSITSLAASVFNIEDIDVEDYFARFFADCLRLTICSESTSLLNMITYLDRNEQGQSQFPKKIFIYNFLHAIDRRLETALNKDIFRDFYAKDKLGLTDVYSLVNRVTTFISLNRDLEGIRNIEIILNKVEQIGLSKAEQESWITYDVAKDSITTGRILYACILVMNRLIYLSNISTNTRIEEVSIAFIHNIIKLVGLTFNLPMENGSEIQNASREKFNIGIRSCIIHFLKGWTMAASQVNDVRNISSLDCEDAFNYIISDSYNNREIGHNLFDKVVTYLATRFDFDITGVDEPILPFLSKETGESITKSEIILRCQRFSNIDATTPHDRFMNSIVGSLLDTTNKWCFHSSVPTLESINLFEKERYNKADSTFVSVARRIFEGSVLVNSVDLNTVCNDILDLTFIAGVIRDFISQAPNVQINHDRISEDNAIKAIIKKTDFFRSSRRVDRFSVSKLTNYIREIELSSSSEGKQDIVKENVPKKHMTDPQSLTLEDSTTSSWVFFPSADTTQERGFFLIDAKFYKNLSKTGFISPCDSIICTTITSCGKQKLVSDFIQPGLILVMGPTSAGKSVVLRYAMESMIDYNNSIIFDGEPPYSSELFHRVYERQVNLWDKISNVICCNDFVAVDSISNLLYSIQGQFGTLGSGGVDWYSSRRIFLMLNNLAKESGTFIAGTVNTRSGDQVFVENAIGVSTMVLFRESKHDRLTYRLRQVTNGGFEERTEGEIDKNRLDSFVEAEQLTDKRMNDKNKKLGMNDLFIHMVGIASKEDDNMVNNSITNCSSDSCKTTTSIIDLLGNIKLTTTRRDWVPDFCDTKKSRGSFSLMPGAPFSNELLTSFSDYSDSNQNGYDFINYVETRSSFRVRNYLGGKNRVVTNFGKTKKDY